MYPILLSLPAIVGTGFFLVGVILSKLDLNPAPADFDPWREPTDVDRVKMAVGLTLFFVCYLGATFGSLLLPLAGYEAFSLTRTVGVRSRVVIWAWTSVALGLVATALFWGWLSKQDIFI